MQQLSCNNGGERDRLERIQNIQDRPRIDEECPLQERLALFLVIWTINTLFLHLIKYPSDHLYV